MRAVDTNVLVRLVTRDQAKETSAAEEFVASGAWVSHLVLAEMAWVLDSVYRLDSTKIALAVDMLLNHMSLTMENPEVVEAALARFRAWPKLGFSDCLIVEIARKAGHLPLGTFDKDLARVDGVTKL
ncbi:MAG: type II toxin-antitoxin system VapC family toxin [Bacteroidota bacterium]